MRFTFASLFPTLLGGCTAVNPYDDPDKSLDPPPKDLADARKAQGLRDDDFSVMTIGETRVLPARPTP